MTTIRDSLSSFYRYAVSDSPDKYAFMVAMAALGVLGHLLFGRYQGAGVDAACGAFFLYLYWRTV